MASKCVWKICFCVCFSLNFVTTSVTRNRALFPLSIVHFNDFHDRFEETSVEFPVCSTNDTNCIGGFPRLYHEIKTLLRQRPDSVLLNAGDTFQGTYWYTLLKWNITQHFLNMIPLDAHTLGNHEFDNRIEGLASYLAALRAPVVVANIDTSQEPSLEGLYKPRIVIERKGRKIGIIGVITRETQTSSKPGKVIFTDPLEAVKKQAQLLTNEGVNIIVVLSHCGIKVDEKIAKEAGKYVDIIVGGHSHSLLWNEEHAPTNDQIVGPYPAIIESGTKRGHLVLVVTASAFTKYLGNITAYFNDEGDLMTFTGNPIFLDRSIPEDPNIKDLMQPYTKKLHKMMNEVVGRTEDTLDVRSCSESECAIGNIVAEAMLYAAKKQEPSELPSVSIINRIMIRGSIPKGNITRGTIINILPFANDIITYTIKGKYIAQALNASLIKTWRKKPFCGPWLPQVAGMKVVVNGSSQTLSSVLIKHGDAFLPLEKEKDYQLTTPDFLVTTGNLFPMLKNNSKNKKIVGVDFNLFEEYIRKISPVSTQLDNRLVVVS